MTGKGAAERDRARAALLTNLTVLPGLGSLLMGRRSGWLQAPLALSGMALSVRWVVLVLMDWSRAGAPPPGTLPRAGLLLQGGALFAAAWVWALATGLAVLRQVRTGGAAEADKTLVYDCGVPDFGIAVVGAGVVGLAVAARLARPGTDLVLLERHERHGTETSSRNSEVIHAGLYYPTGSLKARLCVEGNRLLLRCASGTPSRIGALGKLIVAMRDDERLALDRLLERGRENGARLEALSGDQARRLEPNVPAVAAILSPDTGIVSAPALMEALLQEARAAGAVLHTRAEVAALEHESGGWRITMRGGAGTESFTAERVVNAAGLDADTVAALAGIDVDAAGYRLSYCKGSYFSVPAAKWGLVSRLVYPVPDPVHLGVHVCLGLDGRLRFGPDAEYIDRRRWCYDVDHARRPGFARAVRHLLPAIAEDDLAPDTSGVQARLQGPGEGFRDFVIAEESARGRPGLVNLVGIDSPGLTASLAIAREVERLIA